MGSVDWISDPFGDLLLTPSSWIEFEANNFEVTYGFFHQAPPPLPDSDATKSGDQHADASTAVHGKLDSGGTSQDDRSDPKLANTMRIPESTPLSQAGLFSIVAQTYFVASVERVALRQAGVSQPTLQAILHRATENAMGTICPSTSKSQQSTLSRIRGAPFPASQDEKSTYNDGGTTSGLNELYSSARKKIFSDALDAATATARRVLLLISQLGYDPHSRNALSFARCAAALSAWSAIRAWASRGSSRYQHKLGLPETTSRDLVQLSLARRITSGCVLQGEKIMVNLSHAAFVPNPTLRPTREIKVNHNGPSKQSQPFAPSQVASGVDEMDKVYQAHQNAAESSEVLSQGLFMKSKAWSEETARRVLAKLDAQVRALDESKSEHRGSDAQHMLDRTRVRALVFTRYFAEAAAQDIQWDLLLDASANPSSARSIDTVTPPWRSADYVMIPSTTSNVIAKRSSIGAGIAVSVHASLISAGIDVNAIRLTRLQSWVTEWNDAVAELQLATASRKLQSQRLGIVHAAHLIQYAILGNSDDRASAALSRDGPIGAAGLSENTHTVRRLRKLGPLITMVQSALVNTSQLWRSDSQANSIQVGEMSSRFLRMKSIHELLESSLLHEALTLRAAILQFASDIMHKNLVKTAVHLLESAVIQSDRDAVRNALRRVLAKRTGLGASQIQLAFNEDQFSMLVDNTHQSSWLDLGAYMMPSLSIAASGLPITEEQSKSQFNLPDVEPSDVSNIINKQGSTSERQANEAKFPSADHISNLLVWLHKRGRHFCWSLCTAIDTFRLQIMIGSKQTLEYTARHLDVSLLHRLMGDTAIHFGLGSPSNPSKLNTSLDSASMRSNEALDQITLGSRSELPSHALTLYEVTTPQNSVAIPTSLGSVPHRRSRIALYLVLPVVGTDLLLKIRPSQYYDVVAFPELSPAMIPPSLRLSVSNGTLENETASDKHPEEPDSTGLATLAQYHSHLKRILKVQSHATSSGAFDGTTAIGKAKVQAEKADESDLELDAESDSDESSNAIPSYDRMSSLSPGEQARRMPPAASRRGLEPWILDVDPHEQAMYRETFDRPRFALASKRTSHPAQSTASEAYAEVDGAIRVGRVLNEVDDGHIQNALIFAGNFSRELAELQVWLRSALSAMQDATRLLEQDISTIERQLRQLAATRDGDDFEKLPFARREWTGPSPQRASAEEGGSTAGGTEHHQEPRPFESAEPLPELLRSVLNKVHVRLNYVLEGVDFRVMLPTLGDKHTPSMLANDLHSARPSSIPAMGLGDSLTGTTLGTNPWDSDARRSTGYAANYVEISTGAFSAVLLLQANETIRRYRMELASYRQRLMLLGHPAVAALFAQLDRIRQHAKTRVQAKIRQHAFERQQQGQIHSQLLLRQSSTGRLLGSPSSQQTEGLSPSTGVQASTTPASTGIVAAGYSEGSMTNPTQGPTKGTAHLAKKANSVDFEASVDGSTVRRPSSPSPTHSAGKQDDIAPWLPDDQECAELWAKMDRSIWRALCSLAYTACFQDCLPSIGVHTPCIDEMVQKRLLDIVLLAGKHHAKTALEVFQDSGAGSKAQSNSPTGNAALSTPSSTLGGSLRGWPPHLRAADVTGSAVDDSFVTELQAIASPTLLELLGPLLRYSFASGDGEKDLIQKSVVLSIGFQRASVEFGTMRNIPIQQLQKALRTSFSLSSTTSSPALFPVKVKSTLLHVGTNLHLLLGSALNANQVQCGFQIHRTVTTLAADPATVQAYHSAIDRWNKVVHETEIVLAQSDVSRYSQRASLHDDLTQVAVTADLRRASSREAVFSQGTDADKLRVDPTQSRLGNASNAMIESSDDVAPVDARDVDTDQTLAALARRYLHLSRETRCRPGMSLDFLFNMTESSLVIVFDPVLRHGQAEISRFQEIRNTGTSPNQPVSSALNKASSTPAVTSTSNKSEALSRYNTIRFTSAKDRRYGLAQDPFGVSFHPTVASLTVSEFMRLFNTPVTATATQINDSPARLLAAFDRALTLRDLGLLEAYYRGNPTWANTNPRLTPTDSLAGGVLSTASALASSSGTLLSTVRGLMRRPEHFTIPLTPLGDLRADLNVSALPKVTYREWPVVREISDDEVLVSPLPVSSTPTFAAPFNKTLHLDYSNVHVTHRPAAFVGGMERLHMQIRLAAPNNESVRRAQLIARRHAASVLSTLPAALTASFTAIDGTDTSTPQRKVRIQNPHSSRPPLGSNIAASSIREESAIVVDDDEFMDTLRTTSNVQSSVPSSVLRGKIQPEPTAAVAGLSRYALSAGSHLAFLATAGVQPYSAGTAAAAYSDAHEWRTASAEIQVRGLELSYFTDASDAAAAAQLMYDDATPGITSAVSLKTRAQNLENPLGQKTNEQSDRVRRLALILFEQHSLTSYKLIRSRSHYRRALWRRAFYQGVRKHIQAIRESLQNSNVMAFPYANSSGLQQVPTLQGGYTYPPIITLQDLKAVESAILDRHPLARPVTDFRIRMRESDDDVSKTSRRFPVGDELGCSVLLVRSTVFSITGLVPLFRSPSKSVSEYLLRQSLLKIKAASLGHTMPITTSLPGIPAAVDAAARMIENAGDQATSKLIRALLAHSGVQGRSANRRDSTVSQLLADSDASYLLDNSETLSDYSSLSLGIGSTFWSGLGIERAPLSNFDLHNAALGALSLSELDREGSQLVSSDDKPALGSVFNDSDQVKLRRLLEQLPYYNVARPGNAAYIKVRGSTSGLDIALDSRLPQQLRGFSALIQRIGRAWNLGQLRNDTATRIRRQTARLVAAGASHLTHFPLHRSYETGVTEDASTVNATTWRVDDGVGTNSNNSRNANVTDALLLRQSHLAPIKWNLDVQFSARAGALFIFNLSSLLNVSDSTSYLSRPTMLEIPSAYDEFQKLTTVDATLLALLAQVKSKLRTSLASGDDLQSLENSNFNPLKNEFLRVAVAFPEYLSRVENRLAKILVTYPLPWWNTSASRVSATIPTSQPKLDDLIKQISRERPSLGALVTRELLCKSEELGVEPYYPVPGVFKTVIDVQLNLPSILLYPGLFSAFFFSDYSPEPGDKLERVSELSHPLEHEAAHFTTPPELLQENAVSSKSDTILPNESDFTSLNNNSTFVLPVGVSAGMLGLLANETKEDGHASNLLESAALDLLLLSRNTAGVYSGHATEGATGLSSPGSVSSPSASAPVSTSASPSNLMLDLAEDANAAYESEFTVRLVVNPCSLTLVKTAQAARFAIAFNDSLLIDSESEVPTLQQLTASSAANEPALRARLSSMTIVHTRAYVKPELMDKHLPVTNLSSVGDFTTIANPGSRGRAASHVSMRELLVGRYGSQGDLMHLLPSRPLLLHSTTIALPETEVAVGPLVHSTHSPADHGLVGFDVNHVVWFALPVSRLSVHMCSTPEWTPARGLPIETYYGSVDSFNAQVVASKIPQVFAFARAWMAMASRFILIETKPGARGTKSPAQSRPHADAESMQDPTSSSYSSNGLVIDGQALREQLISDVLPLRKFSTRGYIGLPPNAVQLYSSASQALTYAASHADSDSTTLTGLPHQRLLAPKLRALPARFVLLSAAKVGVTVNLPRLPKPVYWRAAHAVYLATQLLSGDESKRARNVQVQLTGPKLKPTTGSLTSDVMALLHEIKMAFEPVIRTEDPTYTRIFASAAPDLMEATSVKVTGERILASHIDTGRNSAITTPLLQGVGDLIAVSERAVRVAAAASAERLVVNRLTSLVDRYALQNNGAAAKYGTISGKGAPEGYVEALESLANADLENMQPTERQASMAVLLIHTLQSATDRSASKRIIRSLLTQDDQRLVFVRALAKHGVMRTSIENLEAMAGDAEPVKALNITGLARESAIVMGPVESKMLHPQVGARYTSQIASQLSGHSISEADLSSLSSTHNVSPAVLASMASLFFEDTQGITTQPTILPVYPDTKDPTFHDLDSTVAPAVIAAASSVAEGLVKGIDVPSMFTAMSDVTARSLDRFALEVPHHYLPPLSSHTYSLVTTAARQHQSAKDRLAAENSEPGTINLLTEGDDDELLQLLPPNLTKQAEEEGYLLSDLNREAIEDPLKEVVCGWIIAQAQPTATTIKLVRVSVEITPIDMSSEVQSQSQTRLSLHGKRGTAPSDAYLSPQSPTSATVRVARPLEGLPPDFAIRLKVECKITLTLRNRLLRYRTANGTVDSLLGLYDAHDKLLRRFLRFPSNAHGPTTAALLATPHSMYRYDEELASQHRRQSPRQQQQMEHLDLSRRNPLADGDDTPRQKAEEELLWLPFDLQVYPIHSLQQVPSSVRMLLLGKGTPVVTSSTTTTNVGESLHPPPLAVAHALAHLPRFIPRLTSPSFELVISDAITVANEMLSALDYNSSYTPVLSPATLAYDMSLTVGSQGSTRHGSASLASDLGQVCFSNGKEAMRFTSVWSASSASLSQPSFTEALPEDFHYDADRTFLRVTLSRFTFSTNASAFLELPKSQLSVQDVQMMRRAIREQCAADLEELRPSPVFIRQMNRIKAICVDFRKLASQVSGSSAVVQSVEEEDSKPFTGEVEMIDDAPITQTTGYDGLNPPSDPDSPMYAPARRRLFPPDGFAEDSLPFDGLVPPGPLDNSGSPQGYNSMGRQTTLSSREPSFESANEHDDDVDMEETATDTMPVWIRLPHRSTTSSLRALKYIQQSLRPLTPLERTLIIRLVQQFVQSRYPRNPRLERLTGFYSQLHDVLLPSQSWRTEVAASVGTLEVDMSPKFFAVVRSSIHALRHAVEQSLRIATSHPSLSSSRPRPTSARAQGSATSQSLTIDSSFADPVEFVSRVGHVHIALDKVRVTMAEPTADHKATTSKSQLQLGLECIAVRFERAIVDPHDQVAQDSFTLDDFVVMRASPHPAGLPVNDIHNSTIRRFAAVPKTPLDYAWHIVLAPTQQVIHHVEFDNGNHLYNAHENNFMLGDQFVSVVPEMLIEDKRREFTTSAYYVKEIAKFTNHARSLYGTRGHRLQWTSDELKMLICTRSIFTTALCTRPMTTKAWNELVRTTARRAIQSEAKQEQDRTHIAFFNESNNSLSILVPPAVLSQTAIESPRGGPVYTTTAVHWGGPLDFTMTLLTIPDMVKYITQHIAPDLPSCLTEDAFNLTAYEQRRSQRGTHGMGQPFPLADDLKSNRPIVFSVGLGAGVPLRTLKTLLELRALNVDLYRQEKLKASHYSTPVLKLRQHVLGSLIPVNKPTIPELFRTQHDDLIWPSTIFSRDNYSQQLFNRLFGLNYVPPKMFGLLSCNMSQLLLTISRALNLDSASCASSALTIAEAQALEETQESGDEAIGAFEQPYDYYTEP